MMRAVILAIVAAISSGIAHAQTTAAPAGTQINQNGIFVGTTPGTLAGGDALAAEIAARQAAIANLVNRPTIAPLATTIGTTLTTIYPVGSYVGVNITPTQLGNPMTCTGGDGNTYTASYPQYFQWPLVPGGAVPHGPYQCTSSAPQTPTLEAH